MRLVKTLKPNKNYRKIETHNFWGLVEHNILAGQMGLKSKMTRSERKVLSNVKNFMTNFEEAN